MSRSASLAAGVLTLIVFLVLTLRRILKPSVSFSEVTALAPRGLCATILARAKKIIDAIDYLATRREWRYRQPWMLLLGEQGAGKSSLVKSVSATWRHTAPERADELSAPGTQWAIFRHGVLIDIDGKLPVAEIGSDEATRWKDALTAIDDLRPERALDGVVLCISARSLREANSTQRDKLAQNVSRQLSQLQEALALVLPVYVVVTQCDSIPGFTAYWQCQPASRRGEMFGYSSSSLDNDVKPAEWANHAFELMGERLLALQVDVAAHSQHVHDVDNFFLFPGYFSSLREPIGQWFETVFRDTAWQSAYLFRGVYFTGAIGAEGVPTASARSDVSFVDALVAEKALREANLARPTRQGIWSRNRLIRSMQASGIVLLIALLICLLFACFRFSSQVNTLVSAISRLDKVVIADTQENGCPGQEAVYPLLKDVANLNTATIYWSIPASWIDDRIVHYSATHIGNNTVHKVLLPALQCHLESRAQEMMASTADIQPAANLEAKRTSLQKLVSDTYALEKNLARFHTLSKESERLDDKSFYIMLGDLAQYAFGAPVPAEVRRPENVLDDAFNRIHYEAAPTLPKGLRVRLARQIEEQGAAVRQALSREIAQGEYLLSALNKGQPPVLDNTRRFANWLSWTRTSWLGATSKNNPCSQITADINEEIQNLVSQFSYRQELSSTLSQFDSAKCYYPEKTALAELKVAPYGPIFVKRPGGMDLSPGLQTELAGLSNLVSLGFMRLKNSAEFRCAGGAVQWRSNEIAEAASYLQEYEAFAKQLKLSPLQSGGRPLYERLALQALQHAIGDALSRAQRLPQEASFQLVGLSSVSHADEQLANTSKELEQGLSPLQSVLKAYSDYNFDSSSANLRQCIRDFAFDNLGRASALASASRLYVPQRAESSSDSMYDLGNLPVLKDYLSRQVARAQVLATYAAPFLTVLQSSTGVNDAQRSAAQTQTYWNNSVSEINRYVQAKDPSGQIAALDNYFIKQLSSLNYSNCRKVLLAYDAPEHGMDIFSERRSQLEQLVSVRCNDRKQAQALEMYQALAYRFNQELANRYPFGSLSARDASPAVVKAFFSDYVQQRAALVEALADVPRQRWTVPLRFIAQLDAVAEFFNSNLNAGDVSDPISLAIGFHALPKASVGSEQITQWLMTSGMNSAGFPNLSSKLDWHYGQAIALNLSWADRSPWSPQSDTTQRDLLVEGNLASFATSGPWSLLRMINRHQTVAASYADSLNPRQRLLEFVIPVVGHNGIDGKPLRSNTRVYLALTLSGKDPKTKTELTLKLPAVFPSVAPTYSPNERG